MKNMKVDILKMMNSVRFLWVMVSLCGLTILAAITVWNVTDIASVVPVGKLETFQKFLGEVSDYKNNLRETIFQKEATSSSTNFSNGLNSSHHVIQGVPVQHIAFLKIHKAASTTVQNIFLRYGLENDLVFALPMKGSTISIRSSVTKYNILPPPMNRNYDILCCHVKYNRTAFAEILPSDTVYIGIVREPFSQFQSNLQYYRQKTVLNIPGERPVLEFLLHWENYVVNGSHPPSTYNRMSYDFGFPLPLFWTKNENDIQNYLLKLDRELDLVIVTDYFDESIVLMRRILNWDLRFVLYGKLNARKKKDPRLILGHEEEKLYKRWAHLDYTLYDFFLKRLKEKIDRQPPDFFQEVSYFRDIRMKYDRFCLTSVKGDEKASELYFERSAWNKPFNITRESCKYLYVREIPFLNELRLKQKI